MNRRLRVFIVHGHDLKARDSVAEWFRRNSVDVEPLTFSDLAVPGSSIPAEIERITTLGDAAVVVATPDDLGAAKDGGRLTPRARQNVWIELGWFWARLGKRRTLLIVKSDVEIPSDLHGVIHLQYRKSLQEIRRPLMEFLATIQNSEPESVTEVLSVSSQLNTRAHDFQQVFEEARRRAVLMGIGMASRRQYLPMIFGTLQRKRLELCVDFVVLHQRFFQENEGILTDVYRRKLDRDIEAFNDDLLEHLVEYPDVAPRVRLFRYSGVMTFGCNVADPGEPGSRMFVETITPTGSRAPTVLQGESIAGRPRMMLARRCAGGVYDTYLSALDQIVARSELFKIQ